MGRRGRRLRARRRAVFRQLCRRRRSLRRCARRSAYPRLPAAPDTIAQGSTHPARGLTRAEPSIGSRGHCRPLEPLQRQKNEVQRISLIERNLPPFPATSTARTRRRRARGWHRCATPSPSVCSPPTAPPAAARSRPPHGPVRDTRFHAGRHASDREGPGARDGARKRRRHRARQYLSPDAASGRRAHRGARRPAPVHELAAGDPHRFRRLPGHVARAACARSRTDA